MQSWLVGGFGGALCLGAVVVLAGIAFLVRAYVGYRSRSEKAASILDEVMAAATELGMRERSPGVFEGKAAPIGFEPRRMRWMVRDVEHPEGRRSQLALGTPVPTGALAVTHRSMTYGVGPEELELPVVRTGDAAFDVRFWVHADLEHLSILTAGARDALRLAADDAELKVRDGWLWLDLLSAPEVVGSIVRRVEGVFHAASALEAAPTEVEQRVRRLSQDENPKVRQLTLGLLASRGQSEFTSWLARGLVDDPDPLVRVAAAELALDLPRLIELCRAPVPEPVRELAAKAVGRVGSSATHLEAARALIEGSDALKISAVGLCRGVGADAEPLLIELVQKGKGSPARHAVAALASFGSARSLVVLQSIVDHGEDVVLRAEARASLDRLREAAAKRRAATSHPPSATPASGGAPRRAKPGPVRPARGPR